MLSERLKLLRSKKNVSQQKIADLLGITRQAYSMYECGERKPDPDTLIVLADFFACSVDYLLSRTDQCEVYTLCDIDRVAKALRNRIDDLVGAEPETVDNPTSQFPERLRLIRNSRNLTQQQIASAVRIKVSTYSGYETGRREPNLHTLVRITEILGCTPNDLLLPNNRKKTCIERRTYR